MTVNLVMHMEAGTMGGGGTGDRTSSKNDVNNLLFICT